MPSPTRADPMKSVRQPVLARLELDVITLLLHLSHESGLHTIKLAPPDGVNADANSAVYIRDVIMSPKSNCLRHVLNLLLRQLSGNNDEVDAVRCSHSGLYSKRIRMG